MLNRTFPKINERTSLLGLGGMRFPTLKNGEVDEAEAIRMIRHAVDSGVNYLDTAYTYHGGKSERIFGKAFKDGYREKILLADKLPIWLVKEEADVRRFAEEQLKRLETDCIDLYLVHAVNEADWKTTRECNVLPIMEELRAEGKIRYIGFSFHDKYELFEEVIDYYPWDFCQIQLNYMDTKFQAGLAGLEYAASKGIGVVIMEPLKGGRLTDAVPDQVQKISNEAPVNRPPVEWAFKWLAARPEVTTILSGMSSMEQLDQNIRLFSKEDLPDLTSGELARIERVAEVYRGLIKYGCTECRYCMPCPSGVAIPRLIRFINDWNAYEKNPSLKEEYLTWMDDTEHASNCVRCGHCEEHCPQKLPIMDIMGEIVEAFGR